MTETELMKGREQFSAWVMKPEIPLLRTNQVCHLGTPRTIRSSERIEGGS
jgi:hypothetical protein